MSIGDKPVEQQARGFPFLPGVGSSHRLRWTMNPGELDDRALRLYAKADVYDSSSPKENERAALARAELQRRATMESE